MSYHYINDCRPAVYLFSMHKPLDHCATARSSHQYQYVNIQYFSPLQEERFLSHFMLQHIYQRVMQWKWLLHIMVIIFKPLNHHATARSSHQYQYVNIQYFSPLQEERFLSHFMLKHIYQRMEMAFAYHGNHIYGIQLNKKAIDIWP